MTLQKGHALVALLVTTILIGGAGRCDAESTPPTDVVDMDGMRVFLKDKKVEADGEICLEEGILEYLVVTQTGKTYESIIALKGKPSTLQAALLLLGARPGSFPEEFKGDNKGESPTIKQKPEPASRFDIFVEWQEREEKRRVRAERFLLNRKSRKPLENTSWAFTGSYFAKDEEGREYYMADAEGSVVAIWYDATVLFNLPVASRNPYRGDDFGFEVNSKAVPRVGTAVKVVFQLIPSRQEEK